VRPLQSRTVPAAFLVLAACSHAPPPPAAPKSWIERSNENAQLLIDVTARFHPEGSARLGVAGIDDKIMDLGPGHRARERQAGAEVLAQLEERRKSERDPLVAQDLEILIDAGQRQIRGSELNEKLTVPYYPLPRMIFGSVRLLLDDQIAADRRPAALVRVRKYLGLEPKTTSIVQIAEAETREGFAKGLLPPSKLEVENDLSTSRFLVDGVEKLFQKYAIAGSAEPLAELRR
jgi:hypothetical protein